MKKNLSMGVLKLFCSTTKKTLTRKYLKPKVILLISFKVCVLKKALIIIPKKWVETHLNLPYVVRYKEERQLCF